MTLDWYQADLHGRNLSYGNFARMNMAEANLTAAKLVEANLFGAQLVEANLTGANLAAANLAGANLTRANLTKANLTGTILYGANLFEANLLGASLAMTNLFGANLDQARSIPPEVASRLTIVPECGSFIGWKKCRGGRIVKLQIPASAERSNGTGRKCRASKAKVLAIYNADGSRAASANSDMVQGFRYVPGETVTPRLPFDSNRWRECGSGIHFYITRAEAEAHYVSTN